MEIHDDDSMSFRWYRFKYTETLFLQSLTGLSREIYKFSHYHRTWGKYDVIIYIVNYSNYFLAIKWVINVPCHRCKSCFKHNKSYM